MAFDDLRELYQEVILDHGKHPRNFRHPPEANRQARGDNPMCGDKITVYLTLAPSPSGEDVVADAAFEGRGCAISQASASLMTEMVRGKTVAQVRALFENFHDMCTKDDALHGDHGDVDEDAMDRLQVLSGVRQFPMRVKCATLAWHTLIAAVDGGAKTSTE
ncbi:MAG: SUF system NifU family Fe-S cluster assembly protein [Azospirillaceae bacterium]|nr:SUF system NifU family Fe-S cluster assembly protein [Azospirillaceae bacterium]